MKILFLTNYPAPYRVHFFNELGKKCELTVAFEERPEEQNEREMSWFNLDFKNFKAIYLENKKIYSIKDRKHYKAVIAFSIKKLIREGNFDHIILGGYATLTAMYAIQYMQFCRIPYWIEIDGGIKQKRNFIVHALQKHFVSKAKGYFSPSKPADEYLESLGASKDKIFRYPFSSLSKDDILPTILTTQEKEIIRNKLGMKERKIVVSVGQFIPRKGFDLLIKASKQINPDVGIYIIGDGITQKYIDLKEEYDNLDRVHFISFKSKNELEEYYRASDLLCFPTRYDIWGLVINEAMANGLPIITTDKCIAGLTLVDKTNGKIIPTDDVEKIADAINELIISENLDELAKNSLSKIEKYTYANMVEDHLRVLVK